MNRKTTAIALGLSVIGMGIAMPNCPGQQTQQMMEQLTTKQTEMNTKVQMMDNTVKTLQKDIADMKTLVGQMSSTIMTQTQKIEQLETETKAMSAAKAKGSSLPRNVKSSPRRR